MEQLINRLKTALAQTLPGAEAQYLMAPTHRQRYELRSLKAEEYKPSAVMILFCEDNSGNMFIPLTERMTYNGVHSGQISLPGGKFDKNDGDLSSTALRECYEEIGVKEIEMIGKLTPLFIPVSNFLVHPFIGVSKIKNPQMKNQEREVKTILKIGLQNLLDDSIVKHGSITVGDVVIKSPWFEVENLKVWGATAMILSELKQIIKITS
ncbi:NUDIX hydrolase [Aurantibacillus circumpalustris]|uniref:NUDIX hydrolase n=1 Tax=Aurantibacillus circumpalustris TaxID=3036359 RepID=UPI00295BE77D|nr:CoA pyrophosphatase [Aurantibacillus circumpalustris]